MNDVGAIVAAMVAALFVVVAIEDARTMRVTVSTARLITAVAIVGLGIAAVAAGAFAGLVTALVGAVVVTSIQAVPYLVQRRRTVQHEWIGRADVRLGSPFGWTLGWFGLGFVVVGYGTALLAGLVVALGSGRRRVPFVPFLALGLFVGLGWALAREGPLGG